MFNSADRRFLAAFTAAAALASPAFAAEGNGWQAGDVVVRAGPTAILFNSSTKVNVAGNPFPGGNAKLSNNVTASAAVDYFVTRNISVSVNGGIPAKAKVTGAGTLAPLGTGGHVRYGIGALTARYHLNAAGSVSPYVGVGAGHLFVFSTRDGSISQLKADDAWAPVIQSGIDAHLNERVGLYANVSYAPLKTDASGVVMGAPMAARVTLDPTIVQGGLFYRF